MKSILITIYVLFNVSQAFAVDCFESLTEGHSKDSSHFTVNIDDLENQNSRAMAAESVKSIYQRLGCQKPKFIEVSCRQIGSVSFSESCYVETDEGYFFVQPDMVQSINIIFNRFD